MANKCPLHDTVARMTRPAVTAEHCVAVCCASFPFVAGSLSACVWPSSVVTQHMIQLLYIMLHESLHSVSNASFFDPQSSCHVSEQWTSPAVNSRRSMGAHVISGGDPPWKQLLSSISTALARRFSKRLCCAPRLQSNTTASLCCTPRLQSNKRQSAYLLFVGGCQGQGACALGGQHPLAGAAAGHQWGLQTQGAHLPHGGHWGRQDHPHGRAGRQKDR